MTGKQKGLMSQGRREHSVLKLGGCGGEMGHGTGDGRRSQTRSQATSQTISKQTKEMRGTLEGNPKGKNLEARHGEKIPESKHNGFEGQKQARPIPLASIPAEN